MAKNKTSNTTHIGWAVVSWVLPLTANSGTLQIRIPLNETANHNNADKKEKGRETDSMVCLAAKFSFTQNSWDPS